MSIEQGHSEEETNALSGAYVRQIIKDWKEELALSQELLSHTAAGGEFYEFHREKQGFLQDQITLYESMLVEAGYEQEEKPSQTEGL
mgnify:CR=1 FL=1